MSEESFGELVEIEEKEKINIAKIEMKLCKRGASPLKRQSRASLPRRRDKHGTPLAKKNKRGTSPLMRNKSGKPVGSGQRLMLVNSFKFKKNKNPDTKKSDIIHELSEETGIGICTIKRTLAEYRGTGTVTSPNREKKRASAIERLNDSAKNKIRRKVNEFLFRREHPSVNKILQAVNDDPDLPNFKRGTLHRVLHQLVNFQRESRNKNTVLPERQDLILWRRNYLNEVKKYRSEGRTIYYLGETSMNAGDSSVKNSTGMGTRFIVLHIGSASGFLPGGLLCYQSKENGGDYHNERNTATFVKWFKRILPLLDDNAVIVMDEALHHMTKILKFPNTNWNKDEVIVWLEAKGETVEDQKSITKNELIEKVRSMKKLYNKYSIDLIAKERQKVVLQLPPYHTELNPIELAWEMIKAYVKGNNTTHRAEDVFRLLHEGVERVSLDNWCSFMVCIKKEEDKFWEDDHDIVDNMINNDNSEPVVSESSDNDIYFAT